MPQFLLDAQLPPALSRWLTEKRYTSVHVADVGLLAASDSDIREYAVSNSYAIVTKDEDFANRSNRSPDPPVIVWLRASLDSGERLVELT